MATADAAASANTCIAFRGVRKVFGETVVLDDVSLELAAERTTAIVGESGSGKSTLLQLINALLTPDAGEVRVFGAPVDYADPVPLRRRIGYAVQGSALFPHLTIRANVTLLARLVGWSAERIEARLAYLLDLVDLPRGVAERYPHALSGGQQQRVGLCRAMILEPSLLLLDEPFSAVDPITRIGIHDHFQRLQRSEPVSVVLVTHDIREAVKLAQDLVIVREGRILRADTCAAVQQQPGDPWIERLFAEQLG